MKYEIDNNILKIKTDDGEKEITFSHSIVDVIPMDKLLPIKAKFLIVRIDSSIPRFLDSSIARNVFCVDSKGTLLWQVQKSPHQRGNVQKKNKKFHDPLGFTAIHLRAGKLYLKTSTWVDAHYHEIDFNTGEIVRIIWEKN